MGDLSPETSWAIKKLLNNKFYYTVAGSFYEIYITMHGFMKIKTTI